LHRFTEFWEATKPLVLSGEIQLRDSITEGVEKAPQTFVDYLQGKFTGKAIVKVADL
jgi:NADPH-dependent curcumin reductase CurA